MVRRISVPAIIAASVRIISLPLIDSLFLDAVKYTDVYFPIKRTPVLIFLAILVLTVNLRR